jgi:DNA-binding transcriptional LysR family regulator
MALDVPSISTDQLAAFTQLARVGSLRRAAEQLHISEQGLRNRLLAMEQRLGVELYHKRRGLRQGTPLTERGRSFLPHAVALLERTAEVCALFDAPPVEQEVRVAASQYLILYVLIDAIRRFHARFPRIRIRLSTHTEQQIEDVLLRDPETTIGVAAPYEPGAEIEYQHLFAMNWSLVAPRRHRLLAQKTLRLEHLVNEPLILFERGSTGRQHVMDAFQARSLAPRVEMETTNTEIIVRMVEAGLGIAIVPLLPSGAVTRGRRVGIRSLGTQIRPIHSGILTRRGQRLSPASREFVDFVARSVGG